MHIIVVIELLQKSSDIRALLIRQVIRKSSAIAGKGNLLAVRGPTGFGIVTAL